MLTLVGYSNSIIMVNVVDSKYSDEYVFDRDKGGPEAGFIAAFGMTYYDSNQNMLLVPEYGEIVGRVKGWNGEQGVFW